jgi:hypothetical protein
MKYFSIILLFFCFSLPAQNWKKGLAVAGYHMATVAVGAIGDAQNDMGNKDLGHALKAAEVGMLVGGPFLYKATFKEWPGFLLYFSVYGMMRFTGYDGFYNITRDQPLFYNSDLNHYGRFMNNFPDVGKAWYKACFFGLGIGISIKYSD